MRSIQVIVTVLMLGAAGEARYFRTIWETMDFPTDTSVAFCYGIKHCAAGDVNGDGYDDLLITRSYGVNCTDTTRANEVYLFLGGPYLSTIPALTFRGHHIDSTGNEEFGMSLNGLGDINADGYDDFAISAPLAVTDTHQFGAICRGGRVCVYFGGPGLDTVPELVLHGDSRGPSEEGGSIAFGLCGADVNGDGVHDLIVGSPDYSTFDNSGYQYSNRGRVYVYLGGPNIDTIPDVIINGGHYQAPHPYRMEQLGFSIDNCGDVNGDCCDDIIVGAPNNMERDTCAGKAYLFYGGNPMDTLPDWWFCGDNYWQLLGTRVSNTGDFNGDGYKDFMIGDCFWPTFMDPWGRVLMFFGGPNLDTIPDWRIEGLAPLTGNLGSDVDCIGDINGDGYDDIIIGNYGYRSGAQFPGRFLLYFGGTAPDTIPDVEYIGQLGWEVMTSWNLCSAGDVNGDGWNEILFGTNYPPIVPYTDTYGWERVMKYVETAIPDTVRILGGDLYVVARWQARYGEQTVEYQLLRNTIPDSLGWQSVGTVRAGAAINYQIVDSALTALDSFYYWLRIIAQTGRTDLYGPYPGSPAPMSTNFEAECQVGGLVRLSWQITGGDVMGFNVYREEDGVETKLMTIPLTPDKLEYYDDGADLNRACRWFLGVIQGSGAERRFGPIEAGAVIMVFPNPFRERVKVSVRLSQSGIHRLEIYDVSGRRVRTLWSGHQVAGIKEAIWNGTDDHDRSLAAGVYYLVYQMGYSRNSRKIIMLK